MIGPYELGISLGRGGMGVVYAAAHRETGEIVALKTVREMGEGQLASIRREIHALARIRHPGIVRIVAEGVHRGLPWYAMELLEGTTLRAYGGQLARISSHKDPAISLVPTERFPLPDSGAKTPPVVTSPPRPSSPGATSSTTRFRTAAEGYLAPVLTMVRRLCAALSYLHGEGMVHRDLKPENVVVKSTGQPVLLDFGLMWQFTGEVSRDSLDVAGELAGTVSYMAPEQARGEQVDARADLYALGAILFELVVGHPPFVGVSLVEVLSMHFERTPPRPSELVTGVPPELDRLILGLLEKSPRDRLGHADDVAAQLESIGAGGELEPGPRPRAYLYRPSMAGREDAMHELHGFLARIKGRSGGLVLIGGQSGVGKTRLLMELASAARSPTLQVLTGECAAPLSSEGRQPGGDPLHAFRGVLLAVADRCRERGGAETERILGRRGAVLALYQPAILDVPGVRELPPPPQLPPDAARQRLFTYFADTLRELAAEAPIVLVVDDLQWADDLTLGLFAHLGQGDLLSGMGVLVVGAYRTEEAPQGLPSLAAAAHHLSLGRLKDDAIVAIVSEMLAMTPPPDALVRKLARHAEGNPFFVAEYLRTALGEGLLTRDRRGRWQVAGSPDRPGATGALSIPGSLRDLVRRRVQGLSPEARAVLEVGAILGREIDEGLLAAVAGIGDADVIEEIGVLLARQVLEEVEPGRCRFVHDQIRQITADEIATARRRELHRAAAQEMTTRFAADLDPHLAQVGFHWEQAGVKARAQECYLRAGVWSDTRHDYRERERLLRACLALDTEITPAGVGARVDLGDFLIQIYGRTAEARAEQQRALEEARAIGDRATELRALMGLATASRVTGALEEARVLYEQCVTAAHEAGNGTVETSLIGHLAIVHHELGHMEEARDLYEKAIALSSASGQRHTQAINLVNLANLHREQGRVQEALEGYAKALEMHRAARQQRLEAAALVNLGELCLDLGRLDAARNLAEQALEIYREVLNRRAEAYTMNILVTYHRLNGRFTEALRINELVSAAAREIRDRHLLGTSLRELGTIELERGNFASARNALEEAVAIHREARDPRSELYALVPLVAVRRRLGQRAGLDEIVGDALERASSLDQKSSIAAALCEQGHLAIAGGEPARKPLDRAREIARGVGYEPSSELGQAIAALEAAERAREVGGPLLAGEAVERLPPDVQRAIIAAAGRT